MPIGIEYADYLADDFSLPNDNSDFAAFVELEPPKTLASDEGAATVTDDGTDM